MTGITVLQVREGITYDEVIKYALEIILAEHRSIEKVREYAAKLVRSKAKKIKRTLSKKRVEEFQREMYPPIEGNLYEMIFEGKDFTKRAIQYAGSLTGFSSPEDLLPIDKNDLQHKLTTAYEKISGKPYPERKKGEPHLYALLVLEPLRELL